MGAAWVVIAVTALAALVALAGSEPPSDPEPAPVTAPEPEPSSSDETPEPSEPLPVPSLDPEPRELDDAGDDTAWLDRVAALLLVLAGLLALALVVREVRRSRRTGPDAERGPPVRSSAAEQAVGGAEPAVEAIDAALEPLRGDPGDARTAVIEAYARLEEVLARRRPAEAPREYLARVLREHGVSEAPLVTLTGLFEEARFSRHPIPDDAPDAARAALDRLRAEAVR